MTTDTVIRIAAVVAAGALLAAPYWDVVWSHLASAARAAAVYRTEISRMAAAALLIVAACGTGVFPSVRTSEFLRTTAGMVTALKIAVGLALIARALVEMSHMAQAWIEARSRIGSP